MRPRSAAASVMGCVGTIGDAWAGTSATGPMTMAAVATAASAPRIRKNRGARMRRRDRLLVGMVLVGPVLVGPVLLKTVLYQDMVNLLSGARHALGFRPAHLPARPAMGAGGGRARSMRVRAPGPLSKAAITHAGR